MAEFVNRRLERGLGELEQMVRVGLFTDQELKSIISKRQRLEYGVQRHQKSVDDHLKYVKYEMNLLDLLKIRRSRIGYDFKFSDIEGSIGKRCQSRLLIAESKFPSNMEVWKLHIDLCMRLNWSPMASQVYTRMLQVHSDKPEIWMQAATFELEQNGSPDNARALCLKAIRWHEHNSDVWRHYLTTEMRIAMKVFHRAEILSIPSASVEDSQDSIVSGKVASVVAVSGIKTIRTLSYATSLYELIYAMTKREELPDTLWKPVVAAILRTIEDSFSSDPEYLMYRARLCLIPAKYAPVESEYETIKAEEKGYNVFDSALLEQDNESTRRIYMDFIIELYSTDVGHPEWMELSRKRFNKAERVFGEADVHGWMDLRRILSWAQICLARNRKQETVILLEKAVAMEPTQLEDYVRIVQMYEVLEVDSIYEVMSKAQKLVSPKDADFWKTYLAWIVQFEPNQVETAFKRALKQSRPIIAPLSLQYVQWGYGISQEKGRQIYSDIRTLPGVFTEPLSKWIIMKEKSLNASISLLRSILDESLRNLGSESVDLWMEYVILEATYPGGDRMKPSELLWKAQKMLKPALTGMFVTMYNLHLLDTNGKD